MNNTQFLKDIEHKKVLYIPIVSMRSYKDDIYDLACDGNVNRFISNFLGSKDKDLNIDILLPLEEQVTLAGNRLISKFLEMIGNKVRVHRVEFPKGGAGVIRSVAGASLLGNSVLNCLINGKIEKKPYDLVIYESNFLGQYIESLKKFNYFSETGYWCPVSKTSEISPEFLKEYEFVDIELASKCNYMWVASPNQKTYFCDCLKHLNINSDHISINSKLMDPTLDIFSFERFDSVLKGSIAKRKMGYHIVYLPFRLSDKGYHIESIMDALYDLSSKYKIQVLYSDPNNSGLMDSYKKKLGGINFVLVKVPKDRNCYYTILRDIDCVVPYLEDFNNILHATVSELTSFNTKVISLKSNGYKFNNWNIQIDNLGELKEAFEKAFNYKKVPLNIIEGFDRTGKDSFLSEEYMKRKSMDPSKVYIQAPKNLPSYRKEPQEFAKWLRKYLEEQANDLIYIGANADSVVMTRLFVSDKVYGTLFNREPIAELVRPTLSRYFDFNTITLLFKDYHEYSSRVKYIDEEIEYSQEEFEKIQELYRIETPEDNIIYIVNSMSKEKVNSEIKKLLKKNYNMEKELTQEKKIKEMFKVFFDLRDNKVYQNLMEYKDKILKDGIIFCGVGKNWYICEKVTKTFLSMGIPAQALDPVHALHGDLGMIKDQVIVFISRSGTTEELVNLARVLQGLKTNNLSGDIVMVGIFLNNQLPYKDLFDVLILPSKKYGPEKIYEFDQRNLVPSLSINIIQLLLDDFGIKIFESEPALLERYKYNHMGGANGKKLGSDKLLKKFEE